MQGVARVFRHRLRVRYGECDPQGVVFNANYLAYFDVILTEFWREAVGGYAEMVDGGADMVVAESRILFRSPAGFDDELDFELRVARLGNTALVTKIDASVEGRLGIHGGGGGPAGQGGREGAGVHRPGHEGEAPDARGNSPGPGAVRGDRPGAAGA